MYLAKDADLEVILKLAGENANQAEKQGHNVALMGGGLYLLSGSFDYPGNSENKELYNVYLERQIGRASCRERVSVRV